MTPAQKQVFVARMAAARGKSTIDFAPPGDVPKGKSDKQTGWGKCPNCGKNVSAMNHSC